MEMKQNGEKEGSPESSENTAALQDNGNARLLLDEGRKAEIAGQLSEVNARIRAACGRAGRDPGEVLLLAVSKKKPLEDLLAAFSAGQAAFGENFVQELREKQERLQEARFGGALESGGISWHMIGHLQRNKVKYLIGNVSLIHSVDSVELARQIEKEAAKKDVVMDILLEANVAEEESKWGFQAGNLLDAAAQLAELPHVRIRGLMTSAPYTEDPESNRPHFQKLKALFDSLRAAGLPHAQIDTLSMGMSGDFEVAIEEGSTLVRIGTSIFGERHS